MSYGSGVPGFREQLLGVTGNAIVRAKPDSTYADGDDASWMEVDWQALSRPVEVAGKPMNVIDTGGDGPPLLLIHGLGGVWQNWLLTIPAFMGSFRVVAPDLPGFGGSEMPVGRISIQGYARVVDELCSALGIEAPVVVGNSMGGFIGLRLAARRPDLLTSVLVMGTSADVEEQAEAMDALIAAVAEHGMEPVIDGVLYFMMGDTTLNDPSRAEVLAGVRELLLSRTPEYADAAWHIAHRPAILDELPNITIPLTVVAGTEDHTYPPPKSEQIVAGVPHARLISMERTGHVHALENPEAVNAVLEEHLAALTT